MSKRVALYLRVSTDGQTTDNQRRELESACLAKGWQIVEVFQDEGISGSKGRADRPGFDKMLKFMARGKADVLATWAIDRLGRSLQDLLTMLGDLRANQRDLFVLSQDVDTTTPAGRAMFAMMGVFAEFEREMIRSRVISGMERARAQGKTFGRPRVADEVETRLRATLASGIGINRAARLCGVGNNVAGRIAAEMREEKSVSA